MMKMVIIKYKFRIIERIIIIYCALRRTWFLQLADMTLTQRDQLARGPKPCYIPMISMSEACIWVRMTVLSSTSTTISTTELNGTYNFNSLILFMLINCCTYLYIYNIIQCTTTGQPGTPYRIKLLGFC